MSEKLSGLYQVSVEEGCVTVDQLIRDLKMLPPSAIVRARIYGSMKPRTIIHGPVQVDGRTVELILDRDDRKPR